MKKPTILLLFGGESSEHDVSIASARNVYSVIDHDRYNTILSFIDRDGRWWLVDDMSGDLTANSSNEILPVLGSGCFRLSGSDDHIKPDVILPILHGKNGEDGSVQGLSCLMHIPIVGCDVTASAMAMNKLVTKRLASEAGVNIVAYQSHHVNSPLPDYNELTTALGTTLFVKPNEAGSSVGVSKVVSESELAAALEEAHRHSDVALIETAISARELEVAVLGSVSDFAISVAGEIVPEGDFYSYDSKYASGSTSRAVIPAEVPEDVVNKLKLWAGLVYEALGCKGLARVDFFLDENGTLYLNEVNTMPGFTDISMYPKLWQSSGLGYEQLVDRLITDALNGTI